MRSFCYGESGFEKVRKRTSCYAGKFGEIYVDEARVAHAFVKCPWHFTHTGVAGPSVSLFVRRLCDSRVRASLLRDMLVLRLNPSDFRFVGSQANLVLRGKVGERWADRWLA